MACDFKEGCFGKLTLTYFLWLLATLLGCFILLVRSGSGELDVGLDDYAKIVKLVSFISIGISMFQWMLESDPKGEYKGVKLILAVYTMFACGYCGVVLFFQVFEGKAPLFHNEALESVFLILPILLLSGINGTFMFKESGPVARKHKMFLFLVDTPCVVATVTLALLGWFAMSVGNLAEPKEVEILLSGGTAFLVFLTYAVDTMLREFELVPQENDPAVPQIASK